MTQHQHVLRPADNAADLGGCRGAVRPNTSSRRAPCSAMLRLGWHSRCCSVIHLCTVRQHVHVCYGDQPRCFVARRLTLLSACVDRTAAWYTELVAIIKDGMVVGDCVGWNFGSCAPPPAMSSWAVTGTMVCSKTDSSSSVLAGTMSWRVH